jgi:hypothetical protein
VKIAAINVNGTGPYTNKFRATTFRDDLDGNYINAVYPAIGLFFCEKLTDDGHQVMAKAHIAFVKVS